MKRSQDSVQVNAFVISVLSGYNPRVPTLDFIYYNPAVKDLFKNWLTKNPTIDSFILKVLNYFEESELAELQDKTKNSSQNIPAKVKVIV